MRKFNLTILFLLALLPVLFAGQTTRIPYRGIYADDPGFGDRRKARNSRRHR